MVSVFLDSKSGDLQVKRIEGNKKIFVYSGPSSFNAERETDLDYIMFRRAELGDDLSEFKPKKQIIEEFKMEQYELAKSILEGAISGSGSIYQRMASSTPYAVDPLEEVPGLKATVEAIKKAPEHAEFLKEKYLEMLKAS